VAHGLVARLSLVYLLSFIEISSSTPALFEKFPFLRYSAEFWAQHVLAGELDERPTVENTLARWLF
jgi:hypothetical protein